MSAAFTYRPDRNAKAPMSSNRAARRQVGMRATVGGKPGYAGQRVAVWGAAITRVKQARALYQQHRERDLANSERGD